MNKPSDVDAKALKGDRRRSCENLMTKRFAKVKYAGSFLDIYFDAKKQ
jgi:hypothetical protein